MTTDWKHRWLGGVGVAVVMLALVAVPAPASALAPAPGIRVLQNGVTFRALSCRVLASGFYAVGRAGSWQLLVRIQPFSGYHRYDIEYGEEGAVRFYVNPPGPGGSFTNRNEIHGFEDRLTTGGGAGFVAGRSRFGLGYPIAYDSSVAGAKWISLSGTASCLYPAPRR